MNPEDVKLGYLMVASPVSNLYIGGLMVVDGRGLPVEFRYSEPIQPTKIQQVLYGAVLSRYIKTDVILETLLKSVECQPNILIVNDDSFLERDWSKSGFELVRLTETKSPPLSSAGATERISVSEFLIQLTPESTPVRVQLPYSGGQASPGGPKSLPDKSAEVDLTSHPAYPILFETGRLMDILEPMKRLEKALGLLCQEAGAKTAAS